MNIQAVSAKTGKPIFEEVLADDVDFMAQVKALFENKDVFNVVLSDGSGRAKILTRGDMAVIEANRNMPRVVLFRSNATYALFPTLGVEKKVRDFMARNGWEGSVVTARIGYEEYTAYKLDDESSLKVAALATADEPEDATVVLPDGDEVIFSSAFKIDGKPYGHFDGQAPAPAATLGIAAELKALMEKPLCLTKEEAIALLMARK